MGKRTLARLAAAAAGGALAFAAVAPALAHTDPDAGFNAVLHHAHHGVLVDSNEFPQLCSVVRKDAGDAADDLIKAGFDVWVFNASPGEFDNSATVIAEIEFDDGTVSVDGTEDFTWIGPAGNPHLLAVSVTAGQTLVDANFNISGADMAVRVTHTCPDGEPPDDKTPPPETPTPTPTTGNGESPPPGEESPTPSPGETPPGKDDEDEKPGLPVTGAQVGGLVVLGGGLLAAGIAMLAVRRRRDLTGLIDS